MTFPYRTILYDLDGTLIDHFNVIYRCYVHALETIGLPVPDRATVVRTVGGSMEVTMRHFVEENHHAAAVELFRAHFEKIYLEEIHLLPGVPELLHELAARGCRQGVFTNKNGPGSRAIIRHLGLDDILQPVVGSLDTPYRKPQEAFTRHILREIDGTPETTCLVGDSPFDIEAARVVGMDVYGVATGTHEGAELQAAGATAVFANLPAWAAHFGVTVQPASPSVER